MSVKLDQNKNYKAQFGSVFRSSAIFYISKFAQTTISVSNYWQFKNKINVGLLFSVRDLKGNLIERRERYFHEGLVINEGKWPVSEGSVEIEAFSNINLRIPYAAIMVLYETPISITMVHSYGRNHNLLEIEDKNFITSGRESCWTIRHDSNISNKAVFHNGHLMTNKQRAKLILTNIKGEDKLIKFTIPSLRPYETYIFELSDIYSNYKKWLNKKNGWATVHFENLTAFTRLLLIWINKKSGDMQVTHSNFDYSSIDTNTIKGNKPAIMKWPSIISNYEFGEVVIYPKFLKGTYKIVSNEYQKDTNKGLFIQVDKKKSLEFFPFDKKAIPSRIVTGFICKKNSNVLPLECSLGIVHEKRPPKSFHWAVVSKKFKSQLFFNAYPEIYEVPKNILLVFRLYSPFKLDYIEKSINISKLEEIPDGVLISELFNNTEYLDNEDYCYVSMYSNYGGWFMYSSMIKKRSMTIEHSF